MEIRKEGFLFKQSMHLKHSRKRWMVLSVDKLVSYTRQIKTGEIEQNATEIFNLSAYDKVIRAKSCKHYEFELVSTSTRDKRVFEASSIDDMIQWMLQISHCQNEIHNVNKTIRVTELSQV